VTSHVKFTEPSGNICGGVDGLVMLTTNGASVMTTFVDAVPDVVAVTLKAG